jgi:AraC-like DNA-binding protein
MHRDELRNYFYQLTPTELERKNSPTPIPSKFFHYLETIGRRNEDGVFHLPTISFQIPHLKPDDTIWARLDNSPHQAFFRLKKASRFSKEPMAYADFIAIRYVYSGESQITTPNTSFTLHTNDICLLNGGFVFSQYLPHDEDVVFTLMFEKEYLIRNVLHNLKGNDVVTQFIIDYIMENKNPQNYIIFHGADNERIPTIIEDMLCEYIEPTLYGDTLVESYLQILLIEMIHCNYEYSKTPTPRSSSRLTEILNYIDHNYNHVSLEILSKEFGYNSKYLSRLIKNYTGKNFKDFIFEKRMEQVTLLLANTELPIHQIMEQCGLTNETYFYKRFRELYGVSPNEYRKNRQPNT